MEFLSAITLFGSIFWGVVALIILIGICFWADYEETGVLATIFVVIFGAIFYFFGRDTWEYFLSLLTFLNISIYLGAGFLYALVRIFFHGRNQMTKINEARLTNQYEREIDRDIKGDVFRWWFLWPISLINWAIKDAIRDLYNWVYKHLSKVFDIILELGIKSVDEVPKKGK